MFILIAAVGGGSNNNPAPTATISPTSQTADVAQQVPVPSIRPQAPTSAPQNNLSNDNYYVNSDGNTVHSPADSNTVPAGATAQCGDGTYSFSQHRSGTCSHHGGVATWY